MLFNEMNYVHFYLTYFQIYIIMTTFVLQKAFYFFALSSFTFFIVPAIPNVL